jgi:hypothetical protein
MAAPTRHQQERSNNRVPDQCCDVRHNTSVTTGGRHRTRSGLDGSDRPPSIERWLARAFHGTDPVLVVAVLAL